MVASAPRAGMKVVRYEVPSRAEGVTRSLRVLVPRGRGPFSVLYVHDGQNLFDADADVEETWGIDATLRKWKGAPWLVVGIDHRGVDRIADDSPWVEPSAGEAGAPARGEAYARFVAEEATAFIERTYKTTTRRAIAGSSLGGLMALYLGARYPAVFPRIGAFSPTTMWAGSKLFAEWTTQRPERLYLDVGAKEYFENGETVLDYGREVPRFVEHLRTLGLDPKFVLDPDGEHAERDWRRRFAAAVPYLLG